MEKRDYSGIKVNKYFSPKDKDVYGMKEWEKCNVYQGDFKQEGVEFPKDWSILARQMTASKYFYGEQGTPQREYSVKQLINRVSDTMAEWGLRHNYFNEDNAKNFRKEIAALSLEQRMAFNSPVWFNVGVDRYIKNKKQEGRSSYIIDKKGKVVKIPFGKEYEYPQTAACFIQGLNDTMEGIMQLTTNEAMLFKYGSGTGTDLSTLRSSREKLSGGGKPSGPLAYLKFMSDVAGIVRSGGKTRRAAKMNSLRDCHPDIKEFIEIKGREKSKAEALVTKGYEKSEALETVAYQNANLSVRASDEFMQAVIEDKEWQTIPVHSKEMADKMPKYKAKDLMRLIAEGTHTCGDPGMQFHTTINRWHTCPNSAPINASNPCSEYMFVDDSACNLASLNLLKFLNKDGSFDYVSLGNAAKLTAIAQDLEIDNSSYPRKEIAENAHKFRPLGQGYANLGALLMNLGLPYDSDNGRAIAAAITAYQTGKVYEASTEMAEKVGTFEEFQKNKKPMLKVIEMHKKALKNIDRNKLDGLEDLLDEAEKTWNNVLRRGRKYGFRNAQATVLAPTGTIGFMMDCDTLGIEPDYGLIKTKKLFDGGEIKIVNQSVKPALERLGYEEDEIKKIMSYIDLHKTIEGSNIKEKDLPVFDCANPSGEGKRFIHYNGHIKMMAAVQPFLSGAISKTVNIPKETTVEEIEKIYTDAWKIGLKAVAIYRDGSHLEQPLTTMASKKDLETKVTGPVRRKLPTERDAKVHKFNIIGHEGYLIPGLYNDGTPGELFIQMSKEGSTIGGLMDSIATLTSMALQYGVPLEVLVKKFRGQKFDPRGIVFEGHPEIKTADSIIDYVFNYMGKRFLPKEKKEDTKMEESIPEIKNTEKVSVEDLKKVNWDNIPFDERGGFCPVCGKQLWKRGHCTEICRCGFANTNGCGE